MQDSLEDDDDDDDVGSACSFKSTSCVEFKELTSTPT
jgi:hypothetical protein